MEAYVGGLQRCKARMGIGRATWYDGYLGALILTKFDLRVCVIRAYANFGEDHKWLEMGE